jgi:DNA polymerase III subunit epsilon
MIVTGMDFETTGLLEPEHRLIEGAFVMYDFDTEKKLLSFIRRWNPGRAIDPKAQEVHGITFAQVAHLPTLEADDHGIDLIQKILAKSDLVVAHNGDGFDVPFLQQEFRRLAKPLPKIVTVDTMLGGRWATPLGKLPNLAELCFACRVPYDPSAAHAAEYDVEVMMKCFFHAAKRGFYSLPNQLKAA